MTPKDKARELVDKIETNLWNERHISITLEDAMVLTHLTVDEVLLTIIDIDGNGSLSYNWWNQVKQEIDLL